ncbi:MAG: hypothetical protein GY754_05480 [bacterium]|nr:hypothetical protein [bacterium]
MKIIIILLIILFVSGITIISLYAYYGGFKKPTISISVAGGETLLYEEITGDYRQSGIVMDKIYYSLLNDNKIETFKGFGLYFDNPQKVEKSKLRSQAGCIIESKDAHHIPALKNSYSIRLFPEQKYITAEFPYKGKISVLLSIMKVYPALNEFAKLQGYKEESPVMEVYDIPNSRILYRKSIIEL